MGRIYKYTSLRVARVKKLVAWLLCQEVEPLLKGVPLVLAGSKKSLSDRNVTAMPHVGKMPHFQHVKDPFPTARYEWLVGDQFLRLNFLPLPKQS